MKRKEKKRKTFQHLNKQTKQLSKQARKQGGRIKAIKRNKEEKHNNNNNKGNDNGSCI